MGLLLDSSVIITCERKGLTVGQLLLSVLRATGDEQVGLSTVALTELVHGVYRAQGAERRNRREAFVAELIRDVEVYAYTQRAALIGGRISAEQQNLGVRVPYADLLIGATALSLGFAVCTENIRHFGLIPGLRVIPFESALKSL